MGISKSLIYGLLWETSDARAEGHAWNGTVNNYNLQLVISGASYIHKYK